MYDIYDNDFDKAFDEAVEAIEKKEHRLIYADKLKAHYAWWKGGTLAKTLDEMKRDFDTIIDLQPTVDPIKHGRWEAHEGYSKCLNCNTLWYNETPYCPNCGARMSIDGKDEVEE